MKPKIGWKWQEVARCRHSGILGAAFVATVVATSEGSRHWAWELRTGSQKLYGKATSLRAAKVRVTRVAKRVLADLR